MHHSQIGQISAANLVIILIRAKKMGDFLAKNGFTELRIYESTEQLWIRDKSEE